MQQLFFAALPNQTIRPAILAESAAEAAAYAVERYGLMPGVRFAVHPDPEVSSRKSTCKPTAFLVAVDTEDHVQVLETRE